MVNDHYPYFLWLFHWEYTLFSDKPIRFDVRPPAECIDTGSRAAQHRQLQVVQMLMTFPVSFATDRYGATKVWER